jgi:ferric-dicitrate binding protein FerR (iron transport regulator)
MDDFINWPLLLRYLAGECTLAEQSAMQQWLDADPRRREYVASLSRLVAATGDATGQFDKPAAWRAMEARYGLGRNDPSAQPAVNRAARAPKIPLRVRERVPHGWHPGAASAATRRWTAIAASALVALGLAFAARALRHGGGSRGVAGREYATAAGQRLSVTLADGTQLTLAPVSRVRVSVDYGRVGGARDIDLEGEAYFAVTHDATRPFAVRARGVVVRDVGTQFDVRSYAEDAAVRVAVAEGAVAVAAVSDRRVRERPLSAGDMAIVRDTAVAVTHDANIAAVTAWTTGSLVFRDAPVTEVVQAIGRWYDLDIRVSDPTLAARHLTLTLRGESPSQVINGLALLLQARVEQRGQIITLAPSSGSR